MEFINFAFDRIMKYSMSAGTQELKTIPLDKIPLFREIMDDAV